MECKKTMSIKLVSDHSKYSTVLGVNISVRLLYYITICMRVRVTPNPNPKFVDWPWDPLGRWFQGDPGVPGLPARRGGHRGAFQPKKHIICGCYALCQLNEEKKTEDVIRISSNKRKYTITYSLHIEQSSLLYQKAGFVDIYMSPNMPLTTLHLYMYVDVIQNPINEVQLLLQPWKISRFCYIKVLNFNLLEFIW